MAPILLSALELLLFLRKTGSELKHGALPDILHGLLSYSTPFLPFFTIPFVLSYSSYPRFYLQPPSLCSSSPLPTFASFFSSPYHLIIPLLFILNLLLFHFIFLHLLFYPIISLLFLLLLTFDFHTFLRVYTFFFFSFLLPITFFFLPSCCTFFILCTTALGVNAMFCLLEFSIRSVASPVVAATRKPCSCQNGGMCHLKRRACHCPTGYFGRRCERVSCKPGCTNGGHCRDPDQCVCPPHYSGPRCETRECTTKT